jgi:hypothetical protein
MEAQVPNKVGLLVEVLTDADKLRILKEKREKLEKEKAEKDANKNI